MEETTNTAQIAVSSVEQSSWQLAVSWVLTIPLAYFAEVFLIRRTRPNTELSAVYGTLVDEPINGSSILVILFVFAIIFSLFISKFKTIICTCRNHLSFMALAALAMLSCFWSQAPEKSLEAALCLVINTLFAFYLYQRFSRVHLLGILFMFGWLCVVSSIIMALLFPQYGISAGGVAGWRGVYDNKNTCSAMTILLLPAAFYVPTVTTLSKILRIIYLGMSMFLVFMTKSSTGEIALVLLLACVIVIRLVRKFSVNDKAVALLLASTMAFGSIVVAIFYLREITQVFGKDLTLSGRTVIWGASMISILKRPILGYGYMAFWRGLEGESSNALLQFGWGVGSAHNGLLEVWLSLGMLGLVLVLYSFIAAFKNASVCILAGKSYDSDWCICVVFLMAIYAIDERYLVIPNNLAWILYVVACVWLSDNARRICLTRNYE